MWQWLGMLPPEAQLGSPVLLPVSIALQHLCSWCQFLVVKVQIHGEVWIVQGGEEEIRTGSLAISKDITGLLVCLIPVSPVAVCA